MKLTRPMTRIEMIIPFQFRGSGLDATSSWKKKNEVYVIHIIDKLSILPEIFFAFNLCYIFQFMGNSRCVSILQYLFKNNWINSFWPIFPEISSFLSLIFIASEFVSNRKIFRLFRCIRWRWGWLSASGTLRTIDHINRNIISKRWFS